jgi:hypothetical protein
MSASMMTGFCKNEDCPSSHELLGYQTGDLPRVRGNDVRKHLSSCEFCSAEVEFYSHYPPDEGLLSEVNEIPAPLFELAEAILKNRHGDASSLYSLLSEKGELITDKS